MCTLNRDCDESAIIREAADLLRAGELVAFPTETVYGLGANALQPSAVAKIFAAKGRPSRNPLIVHVLTTSLARDLVTAWPDTAARLAEAFWPGPLTLVLPRTRAIPDIVTGGSNTVGLRVPAHPVARKIIALADLPIAAPSANRSNAISPTRAEHVLADLKGRIPLIVDGGPTNNVESTVIDLSAGLPRLLRPGPISTDVLKEVLGAEPTMAEGSVPIPEDAPLPSPGQLRVHYAPSTPSVMLPADEADALVAKLSASGKVVARLTSRSTEPCSPMTVALLPHWQDWQERLYDALHMLDELGADIIVVDEPPRNPQWAAVYDRLKRACARGVPW